MPVLELEKGTITLADEKTESNSSLDPRMGALNCSKCNCGQYEQADYVTHYCACKHSYEDHW